MRMHIGHVALQVTDIERSAEHAARTLGLRESKRTVGQSLLSANAKHHELQLIASDRAGLDHIGLELEDKRDLEQLRDRLTSAGVTILSSKPEEDGLDEAFRCVAPAGVVFEIYTGMERAPLSLQNVLGPFARKLGHVTLFSDQKDALEQFILELLGFKVSDRFGELGTWMRCDADHHGLSVGMTPSGTRLNHYAFEFENLAAIGAYADHLARDGQHLLRGPGRHGPGFNIFTYLRDPEGAIIETYADMIRINDDASYRPLDWSSDPRAMNLWGQGPPEGWDQLGVPVLSPSSSGP